VVVDVGGYTLQVPMEELLAMLLELAELPVVNVPQIVLVHQELEHSEG